MKEVRAFFLSPIPAAILGAIVSWASGGSPRPEPVAILYLLLLYAAQLLFGVAIRAFLLTTRRGSATSFLFGGMVMTGIPSVPYLAWAAARHPESWPDAIFVLVLWLLLGGLTGLSYWHLARPAAKPPVTA